MPFHFATGIYVLNWITFDLVSLMPPFMLSRRVSSGDLPATMSVFGGDVAMESVVLGLMLVTAVVALPVWRWLARLPDGRLT